MQELKEIKNLLKDNKKWAEYKKKYKHPQMRLIFSKIIFVFNKDVSIEDLYKKELQYLEADKSKQEEMFKTIFKSAERLSGVKADWESFAIFMWYVYQTSTYWKDIKKNVKNVFNVKNYNELNQVKRNHYNDWLHSLSPNIENLNNSIIEVLRLVY